MNFQRGRYKEEPEINLVPLIDVMMVILIFLMITTTYSKYTELQINLPTADAARQAFEEGVPLVLKLDIEASVERRLLPADDVVQMTREWQLAYDAIAERFVVTDAASGAHVSHATEAEALEALSRISGITIADTATLPEGQRFDMRVRATVEIGELPAAVRLLLFWKNWSRTTEWYAWKVRP